MAIFEEVGRDSHVVYTIKAIYDLSHEVRYVGISSRPMDRFIDHLREARTKGNLKKYYGRKSEWIRQNSFQVSFEILEVCSSRDDLLMAEMKWIHILGTRGNRLLNYSDGGESGSGLSGPYHPLYGVFGAEHPAYGSKRSSETLELMSQSQKGERGYWYGKTFTEEHKSKIACKSLGRNHSGATKVFLSNHMLNRVGGMPGAHTRHHLNKGHTYEGCQFCEVSVMGAKTEYTHKLKLGAKYPELAKHTSRHNRWHRDRGMSSESCPICTVLATTGALDDPPDSENSLCYSKTHFRSELQK